MLLFNSSCCLISSSVAVLGVQNMKLTRQSSSGHKFPITSISNNTELIVETRRLFPVSKSSLSSSSSSVECRSIRAAIDGCGHITFISIQCVDNMKLIIISIVARVIMLVVQSARLAASQKPRTKALNKQLHLTTQHTHSTDVTCTNSTRHHVDISLPRWCVLFIVIIIHGSLLTFWRFTNRIIIIIIIIIIS